MKLSEERARRLAELRAKYPKPEPEPEPRTEYCTSPVNFFAFVSGILQAALGELDQWNVLSDDDYWKPLRSEDVNEVKIEHAFPHYSRDSWAWTVYLNWHSPTPKYMTILYDKDEGFVVDDL